ncbi:MAG TPA: AraC family transcriptional regulator [Nevskiaceae bacterium]|nr:AraC family transcriptional regulator [Nevskiaceae bacterium]
MAPPSEKDTVSIAFVRAALAGLERRGGDPATVLVAAGIPTNLLASDHSRVSATSFGALWLAIAAAIDDELFGMDTRRMKVGSFALLCRAAVRAPNLEAALDLVAQTFNVVMDDARVHLHGPPGDARLVVEERSDRALPFRVFAHETILIMLHGVACWLIGRRIPIRQAAFAYPRPAWSREYLSMYATDCVFDAAASSITFAARTLDAAVVQDPASTREFLRDAPHNFIVKYKDAKSFAARIRRRLRGASPALWPQFADLSEEFGVAESTLHRRLEQEGTSFREIRDALRRDLAIDKLTHSDASVADIAEGLGFAEPSAFHRAFKQWTGVRPGDYRREAHASP